MHDHKLLLCDECHLLTVLLGVLGPTGMSLFCTGWTYIWLLVLPFGIFPEASWWSMLPVSVMTAMMLGMEDLASQLEDPFKFMPYGERCGALSALKRVCFVCPSHRHCAGCILPVLSGCGFTSSCCRHGQLIEARYKVVIRAALQTCWHGKARHAGSCSTDAHQHNCSNPLTSCAVC
jgi:hypothetical protein